MHGTPTTIYLSFQLFGLQSFNDTLHNFFEFSAVGDGSRYPIFMLTEAEPPKNPISGPPSKSRQTKPDGGRKRPAQLPIKWQSLKVDATKW